MELNSIIKEYPELNADNDGEFILEKGEILYHGSFTSLKKDRDFVFFSPQKLMALAILEEKNQENLVGFIYQFKVTRDIKLLGIQPQNKKYNEYSDLNAAYYKETHGEYYEDIENYNYDGRINIMNILLKNTNTKFGIEVVLDTFNDVLELNDVEVIYMDELDMMIKSLG